jgi:Uncharacterized protein conserved in bacteria (DUF2334)
VTPGEKLDTQEATTVRAEDQLRTARLLLDAELAAGAVAPAALSTPAVRAATRVRAVPSRPLRVAEQVRYKLRNLDFDSGVVGPLLAARNAALGAGGAAPPRFLIRVDEFPHYQAWDDPDHFGTAEFERFHNIMAGAGVPYLVAVLPRVSREPLSPTATGSRPLDDAEVAMLHRLASEGASFGLHGRDHRTRSDSPRGHSELCGLTAGETELLLDDGLAELARHDISPDVFVPPYNRFDARQLEALARRFQVVCGGPESIGLMGFQRPPQWRGDTVYLPSYAPVYGTAAEVLGGVEHLVERQVGLWVPVVLHWGWEAGNGFADLQRLLDRIAPYAARWEDFHDAIARSRTQTASAAARAEEPGEQRGTLAVDG